MKWGKNMSEIKITIVESKCRGGHHKEGDCYNVQTKDV